MLGMTQPAVSRTLSMLERRVGEPLFTPGKRPLQLTPLGRQLAIQGRSILAASRKAVEIVRSFQSGTAGRIKVGGVPFFMDAVISQMIASFQLRERDILVEQSYGNLPDLLTELDSSQIDVAITPIGSADLKSDFEFQPILPGRNVLTCAVGHPLLRKRRLGIDDIMTYPWVAPLPGSPLVLDLHNILITLGISELQVRYSGGPFCRSSITLPRPMPWRSCPIRWSFPSRERTRSRLCLSTSPARENARYHYQTQDLPEPRLPQVPGSYRERVHRPQEGH